MAHPFPWCLEPRQARHGPDSVILDRDWVSASRYQDPASCPELAQQALTPAADQAAHEERCCLPSSCPNALCMGCGSGMLHMSRQGTATGTLPGRSNRLKAQVEHAPSRGQPLPRRLLQQLHLHVIVSRADVLDIPRPAMGGVHDLHGLRPDAVFTVRTYGTEPAYGLGLVHNFSLLEPRKPRSAARGSALSQNVAQLGKIRKVA